MILNKTLQDLFLKLSDCSKKGITFINTSDKDTYVSYEDIINRSLRILGSLQEKGIREGDELVFQIQESQLFLEIFWACILGKIIPVPVNFAVTNDLKNKLGKIFKVLNSPHLITTNDNYNNNLSLDSELSNLLNNRVLLTDDLLSIHTGDIKVASLDDIAYIQFSSGSTGNPKGVVLTHKNLITNIDSIHEGIDSPEEGDSFYSWMPLTHDMGLIGFHLTPLAKGWNHYIMPTELFMRNPSLWLRKISEYKITFTSSPNFGYQYVLKHFRPEKNQDVDLSSLRIIVNGAEPISLEVCNRFLEYFKDYGLKNNSIFPVYGLAEASLAVSFSKPDEEIYSIKLNRNRLNVGDEIEELSGNDSYIEFVGVGEQIKNTSVQIIDKFGKSLENNFVGKIQISGDNVTSEYYNNEKATLSLISKDGWLNTGDLGFKDKNENLYIVGRDKDIIFVNGGNYYSHDIERIAEKVQEIELGKIVIAADFNSKLSRDEIIAFILFRGKLEKFLPIKEACQKIISTEVGINLDQIIPVKSIPKTTSGKVQRYKLLTEYLNGEYKGIIENLEALAENMKTQDKKLPQNNLEEKILEIWQNILNIKNIGTDEDFFILGGDSLKAGQMVMHLQEELYLDISIEDLYNCRTIIELAKRPVNKSRNYNLIDKPRESKFGLSHAQNRIFYFTQINKDSVAYNVPQAFIIEAEIDVDKFKQAFTDIVKRHDVLRTTFHIKEGKPYQEVHKEALISINETHFEIGTPLEEQLEKLILPFNLEELPLIRINYGLLQAKKMLLFVDVHHIVVDGSSVINIIKEFFRIYNGEELINSNQYIDHVLWEQKVSESDKYENAKKYWESQFNESITQLNLPYDFSELNRSQEGARFYGTFDKDLNQELQKYSNKTQITKSAILLAAYSILLNKLSNQDDIVIGIAEAGRNHSKFQDLVGMFVNSLAFRCRFDEEKNILEYLESAHKQFVKSLDNKSYTYSELVDLVDAVGINGRNPLFDTMFVYHNMEIPELSANNFKIAHFPFDPKYSKFDLSLEIFEGESLNYNIEYSTSLFKKESIARYAEYYEKILKLIIRNDSIDIKDISLLSEQETKNLVTDFNQTDLECPNSLIYDLIDKIAIESPDLQALYCNGETLTYGDLKQRTDALAEILVQKGAKVEDFVAIVGDKSIEFVISVLGILKAGCAFVPIDINYPESRREYILNDCKPRFILTTKAILDSDNELILNFNSENIIQVDNLDVQEILTKREVIKPSGDNLAYMIYTSGTSGKPKGAMIEHRNLLNYIWWAQSVYVRGDKVNFPLFTSVAFDLTITSIFIPLITANTLYIYTEDSNDLLIEKVLNDDKVGVIKLTPSHLKIIKDDHKITADKINNLKRLIVGGEDLSSDLAQSISSMFSDKIEIFNEYGPTETTVGCMIYKYDPLKEYKKSVPIGKPAGNAEIYLLDKYLNPVLQGVIGEIYIGGKGVCRGYHNKEELTNEKFITRKEISNSKLYRSGDLGRFNEEYDIEFLGRIDQQVKINGYRIELDEIELCLKEFEGVVNASVIVVDRNGSSILSAFYTSNQIVNDLDIRLFMQEHLPHYMVPTLINNIDKIPLTKNGKVDNVALQKLSMSKNKAESKLAENEIQEILVEIFQDVLNVDTIGIEDNFFELGGDSIKAVQITSRLYDKGISLNVKDILTHQIISQISQYAESSEKEYDQGIVAGNKELSPIEKWFFEQEFENPHYFNQSVLLEFKKNIDKNILEQVFKKLIEHHDGLRLNYNPDKKCMFYNNEYLNRPFEIEVFDINDKNTLESIGIEAKSSFDILKSLLIKAVIIQEENNNDKLLITAHHMVIDGVSWRIILEDLYNLYKSLEDGINVNLPKKTGNLIDWQNALNEYSSSDELKAQADYWNENDGEEILLKKEIDTDNTITSNLGRSSFNVDKITTEYLLGEANKVYNTDIQILLLISLARAINENTEINNLVFELENHGRIVENLDISRTTGWFTAMYPVHLEIGISEIGSIIKEVKEKVKKVPDNGIGYGVLRYLNQEGNKSVKKRSDVRFNYLGQFGEELSNSLFSYSNEYSGVEISENNQLTATLEVNCLIINGELNVELNYCNFSFTEYDIIALKERFNEHINILINHLKNKDDIHFTPSDFDGVALDEGDLDILFG